MRKAMNIAAVLGSYAVTSVAAYFLFYGPNAPLSTDYAKWLWGPAALLIGLLVTLGWKIHDAKRVEGLRSAQREKLRFIAGRVQRRLYSLSALTFAGAFLGTLAAFLRPPYNQIAVTAAFAGVIGSSLISLILYPLTQKDVQDFEDAAREKIAREKEAKDLRERLKLDAPSSSTGSPAA